MWFLRKGIPEAPFRLVGNVTQSTGLSTTSADRLREEMASPRRYLALVCFLHQARRETLD